MSEPSPNLQASRATRWALPALVGAAVLLLGRVMGLGREVVLAPLFGTGDSMDAFVAARTIPEVVLALVSAGTVRAILIPEMARAAAGSDRSGDLEGVHGGAILLVLAALVFSVLMMAVPSPLIGAVAPGIGAGARATATGLLQILAIATLFQIIAGTTGAFLNFRGGVALPTIGPVFVNGAVILLAVLLSKRIGISSVAWGWLVGAGLYAAVLVVAEGPRAWSASGLTWGSLRRGWVILGAAAPILIVQVLIYGRFIVEREFGSFLPSGALSSMNYANKVMQMPVTIVTNGIVAAYLPRLARLYAASDGDGAHELNVRLSRQLVEVLAYPAAVFLALSVPTIHLVFQRGAFTSSDTAITGSLLMAYGSAVVPMGLLALWTQSCYAARRPWRPMRSVLIGLAIQVVLSLLMLRRFGVLGVVWGSSAGMLVSAGWLGLELARLEGRMTLEWSTLGTIALRAGIAGGAGLATFRGFEANMPWLARYAMALLISGVLYFAPSAVLLWRRRRSGWQVPEDA